MAYTDTIGDVVRVTMAWKFADGQVEETNVSYQCVASGGTDTRSNINGHVDTIATTNLGPVIRTTEFYFGSRVSFEKTAALFAPTVTRINAPGAETGATLPTQVRPLVTWRTAKVGRRFRGRSFLPTPTVDTLLTEGNFSSGLTSAMKTWADAMMATYTTGGSTWIPGIYHRKPTALISDVFSPYTANEVTTRPATQRRSGRFGRLNNDPW